MFRNLGYKPGKYGLCFSLSLYAKVTSLWLNNDEHVMVFEIAMVMVYAIWHKEMIDGK